MNSDLAVIILNYFGSQDSFACVRAVNNTLKATVFLIDNSADETEKIRIEHFFKDSPEVRLYFPADNLGFSAGVNFGLRKAVESGFRRFLLLNNDALLLANAGPVLERAFQTDANSLITSKIRWGKTVRQGNFYHRYFGLITRTPFGLKCGWHYFVTGCALAFDLEFLDNVGYLNEAFFMYGEDIEYSYRAVRSGAAIRLLEHELVQHTGSKAAQESSLFYEYHLTRSHFLLSFEIIRHPVLQVGSLIAKGLILSFRAILRSGRYKRLSPLLAYFLAPFPLRIRPKRKNT